MSLISLGDHRLEVEWQGSRVAGKPELVFLHEGLGSISAWRDFPARVSRATGLAALVYSRRGYGKSDALARPFEPGFMHDEARFDLGALLEAFSLERPILVGHSDGASIALVRASLDPTTRALVLMAPHVFVEDVTTESIAELRAQSHDAALVERFRRHHGSNTEALLDAWTGVWLAQAFRSWSLLELLPKVRCPVLLIQGEADEYGTKAQLDAIARGVSGRFEMKFLAECGHSPHRDQPDLALEEIVGFVKSLGQ